MLSFSFNYTSEIPEDVDRGWFYFFVTLLNQFYWVASATIGGIIGSLRSGFLYDSDNDTDCTSKVAGTMATRYLPFLIFKENKKTPEYIQYLGKFSSFCCFRNVSYLLSEKCVSIHCRWNYLLYVDIIFSIIISIAKGLRPHVLTH